MAFDAPESEDLNADSGMKKLTRRTPSGNATKKRKNDSREASVVANGGEDHGENSSGATTSGKKEPRRERPQETKSSVKHVKHNVETSNESVSKITGASKTSPACGTKSKDKAMSSSTVDPGKNDKSKRVTRNIKTKSDRLVESLGSSSSKSSSAKSVTTTNKGRRSSAVDEVAANSTRDNDFTPEDIADDGKAATEIVLNQDKVKVTNVLPQIMNGTWNRKPKSTLSSLILNSSIRNLKFTHLFSLFTQRVTALSWHPTNPDLLVFASKGGELCCYNDRRFSGSNALHHLGGETLCDLINDGIGPGGSINTIKFDPANPQFFYTTSIAGEVVKRDVGGKTNDMILKFDKWGRMFNSLDINYEQKFVMAGDDKGYLHLIANSRGANEKRCHRSKINHIEIHPHNRNIFVTASVDHTVKVWDLRFLHDLKPVIVLSHDKAVNSCSFSSTNGGTLMTTNQYAQIRLYLSSTWQLERTIYHPHRHFQHITPIRASWHPLCDVAVVGRYPDDRLSAGDQRCVDFFDVHIGEILHQLTDDRVNGLTTLNEFNCTGDTLASAVGSNLIVWKHKSFLAGLYDCGY